MSGPAPKIVIRALTKSCGAKKVLQGVDLQVHAGETLAVVGESGSGKELVARALHKHSPRAGRKPQPAQKAARELFTQSAGDPMAALIIKEFGIYPPGVFVQLASGEMAVVTQRGASANAPIVAAITNKSGDPLAHPARRDTSAAAHAIVSAVPQTAIKVQVSVDALYDRHANR